MTRTLRRMAVVVTSISALAMALAAPAFAANPDHVNFTLQGCRLPVGATLPSNVVCADSQYTTGNLGKSWNELDLVPYRLSAVSGPDQTYTMAVALDAENASKPGYDVISAPVVNATHSDSACDIVSVSGEKIMSPGIGGISKTRYRELTVHQGAGATCVFDYYGRLAIDSHLFPGSSLHANKALVVDPTHITVSGIGASDVSIPVKEIAPQTISKDMSANQGSAYTWSVQKQVRPATLNFGNTCGSTDEERTATVTVSITWQRTAPSGTGDITLTTHVFATNPAARVITVNVNDKIYKGTTQTTQLGSTLASGDVDVPANTTKFPVLTHTQTVPAGTDTAFNDVATATYIDKLTGVAVNGNTTAAASANLEISNNPLSATAEIRDTESISGDGLTFSTGLPTGTPGSFSGYTAGTRTTGPVNWSSGTVSDDGEAVFTQTVYLDQPRATTGTLSDTADVFITGDLNSSASASATTDIDATLECAAITIVKTGKPDVVHDGDNVTFTYAVTNPSSQTVSVSDVTVSDDKCADVQGPIAKSEGNDPTLVDDDLLDPGETWTFRCTTPALHSDEDSDHVITNVATASGFDPLGNQVSAQDDDTTKVIHPAIKIDKTGPATAQAGEKIVYVLTVTNPGDTPLADSTVVVTDAQCNGDPVALLSKGGDGSPDTLDPGDVWTYTCSVQTAAGDTGVENHASVVGQDQLGQVVDSAAAATTVLTQPQQVVLGERATPGAARLLGPTGCQSRAFNARVRGSKMATLTFTLDGKVVKKIRNTKNAKVVAFRINPKKLRVGVHRLVVTVTFQSGSATKPKTFRLSFQRCAKKLVAPRFTG